jgi:hypothetical protein
MQARLRSTYMFLQRPMTSIFLLLSSADHLWLICIRVPLVAFVVPVRGFATCMYDSIMANAKEGPKVPKSEKRKQQNRQAQKTYRKSV